MGTFDSVYKNKIRQLEEENLRLKRIILENENIKSLARNFASKNLEYESPQTERERQLAGSDEFDDSVLQTSNFTVSPTVRLPGEAEREKAYRKVSPELRAKTARETGIALDMQKASERTLDQFSGKGMLDLAREKQSDQAFSDGRLATRGDIQRFIQKNPDQKTRETMLSDDGYMGTRPSNKYLPGRVSDRLKYKTDG